MSMTKNDSKVFGMPLLAAGAVILAAGSASAAGQEPISPVMDGYNISAKAQPANTLRDAMIRAGQDKAFSSEFLRNPEKFRGEYNLTDSQISSLKRSQMAVSVSGTDKFLDDYVG